MKLKKILIAVFSMFVLSPTFSELPKVGNTDESISNAFQELIFNIINPFENVDWHDESRMLQAYSYHLENLTYEKVREYVSEIDKAMRTLETSGTLSKGKLENFRNEMERAYCDLSGVQVPDSVSLNYDDDQNIKILEQNAEIYKKRIADCQEKLKGLPSYDSNRKRLQSAIESDTYSLDAIPARIERYKTAIKDEYKKGLSEKVRAFSTWKDFFDGKNTVVKEFLELLDTKKKLQTDFDNLVPMKDTKLYQPKLDAFISGWEL